MYMYTVLHRMHMQLHDVLIIECQLHKPFIKLPHEFNMTIRCSINNAIHKRVTQIDLLAGPVTSSVCVCVCVCVCVYLSVFVSLCVYL